jgi:phosphate transport system substrate-binding protein
MRNLGLLLLLSVLVLTACGSSASAQPSSSGSQRTIEDIGSDTIVNLALAWAEAYQKINSDVSISVSGGGSGTGLAALINAPPTSPRQPQDQARRNGGCPKEWH